MSRIYSFFTLPCFRAILPIPIEGNAPNFFTCLCSIWFYVSIFSSDAYGVLGAWFISTVWSVLTWVRHGHEFS